MLENSSYRYELFEHEPVYTSKQAAEVRGITQDQGIKCLLLKSGTRFILVVTRGDRRIDMKKVAALENIKKVELANDREIEKNSRMSKRLCTSFL